MALLLFAAILALALTLGAMAGKHRTVKAIDVAGLKFLSPVVRLCYGEDPQKQLSEIGRFILVPLLAVGAFVVGWSIVSEQIQTKSGKLPSPLQTWGSGGRNPYVSPS